jgi:hypothetical protein
MILGSLESAFSFPFPKFPFMMTSNFFNILASGRNSFAKAVGGQFDGGKCRQFVSAINFQNFHLNIFSCFRKRKRPRVDGTPTVPVVEAVEFGNGGGEGRGAEDQPVQQKAPMDESPADLARVGSFGFEYSRGFCLSEFSLFKIHYYAGLRSSPAGARADCGAIDPFMGASSQQPNGKFTDLVLPKMGETFMREFLFNLCIYLRLKKYF